MKKGIHINLELPFTATEASATFDKKISFDEWLECGRKLLTQTTGVKDSFNWYIGDFLNAGEEKFGERYAQAISDEEINIDRARQLKFVASRIKPNDRYGPALLSWSHHRVVAVVKDLTDIERAAWLKIAVEKKLTTRELKETIDVDQQVVRGEPKAKRKKKSDKTDGAGSKDDLFTEAEEFTNAPNCVYALFSKSVGLLGLFASESAANRRLGQPEIEYVTRYDLDLATGEFHISDETEAVDVTDHWGKGVNEHGSETEERDVTERAG